MWCVRVCTRVSIPTRRGGGQLGEERRGDDTVSPHTDISTHTHTHTQSHMGVYVTVGDVVHVHARGVSP